VTIRRWSEGIFSPNTPDFVAIATRWQSDVSVRLLQLVWKAYDSLRHDNPESLRPHDERNVTQHLETRIRGVMTGYEPYEVQHGAYEWETRHSAQAQPPQYDIAFKIIEEERIMWPLEAKILRTDRSVANYVADVRDQFLTCRYAPFSSEGGMLGYLLSGEAETAFRNIALHLECHVQEHPAFKGRPHRLSRHIRTIPTGKAYPSNFTCHHLILVFTDTDDSCTEE